MLFPNAQYVNGLEGTASCIEVEYADYKIHIPLDPNNSDYAEIMRQVEAGELTIQPADNPGE